MDCEILVCSCRFLSTICLCIFSKYRQFCCIQNITIAIPACVLYRRYLCLCCQRSGLPLLCRFFSFFLCLFRHYYITTGYCLFSLFFYDCFHRFRFLHLLHSCFLSLCGQRVDSHSRQQHSPCQQQCHQSFSFLSAFTTKHFHTSVYFGYKRMYCNRLQRYVLYINTV